MTWQMFWLFVVSTFFVSAAPGSNMLYAFQMGLNHGLGKTLWTMAGLSFGLGLLLLMALLGLGVIAKYPLILTMIKCVGAVYLFYLGMSSWHANKKMTNQEIKTDLNPFRLFQNGVWVSLSNPKAILFFAAFFPKFIDFKSPLITQYIILIVTFYCIETLWQFIYAAGGVQLSNWLNSGQRMLYLNRLCGVVFIGIGMMLMYDIISTHL